MVCGVPNNGQRDFEIEDGNQRAAQRTEFEFSQSQSFKISASSSEPNIRWSRETEKTITVKEARRSKSSASGIQQVTEIPSEEQPNMFVSLGRLAATGQKPTTALRGKARLSRVSYSKMLLMSKEGPPIRALEV